LASSRTAVRVRDLVHGYVDLTELEISIVNAPLFQRLRNIRQNDVGFYVYPSLNTSRFEHSLGCTHVAGKMAQSLRRSAEWDAYKAAVNLNDGEIEQVCRLYALLHDVGHLPLSHLFETAFDDFAYKSERKKTVLELCAEWFGGNGFSKLHEACGSAVATRLLEGVPEPIKGAVIKLTSQKSIPAEDPLRPIKQIVDSEIDADRIDSTARDGLAAGGEYGTFDGDRIASAVRVQKHSPGWRLAFSEKALSSLEALLLDRYRTHTWIHYHHRVVAMKAAATEVIGTMLMEEEICKGDFKVDSPEMTQRDDIWLWSKIRDWVPRSSTAAVSARESLLLRDTRRLNLLWKSRADYDSVSTRLRERSGRRSFSKGQFGRAYEARLEEKLGSKVVAFWLPFKPVGNDVVPIVSETGEPRHDLLRLSPLVESLERVWSGEPQWFAIVFGEAADREQLCEDWINETAKWLQK
jgi:HD superfamily phosphohydrolase